MPKWNPEDSDGPMRLVVCTASMPPSETKQVGADRQDRVMARKLDKCRVPRFALLTRGGHCGSYAAVL
jgi:hypothetical protein